MTKKCLDNLIETIAILKTDVAWIKKLIYVTAGCSISTTLGLIIQLILRR